MQILYPMKPILKSVLSIFILFLFGCQQEKPAKNLSYTKRKKIDSLFNAQAPMLDSILELECLQLEGDMLQYWVDSLYEERMKEITKLRGQ